jgi:hypothetical protein
MAQPDMQDTRRRHGRDVALINEAEAASKLHVAGMPGDASSARLAYQVGYLEGIVRMLCDELKSVSNPNDCFGVDVDGVTVGVAFGPDEAVDFMIGGQVVNDLLSVSADRQLWRAVDAHMLAERQEAA